MFAFPSMLFSAADKCGIKRPPDEWDEKWDEQLQDKFPHFYIFCMLQLARPMEPGEHWDNAEIISKINECDLKTMRLEDFIALGLRVST